MKLQLLNALCAGFIAEVVPTLSNSNLLSTLGSLFFLIGGAKMVYELLSHRKQLLETEPKRRIMPDPLRTQEIKDFVSVAQFDRLDQDIDSKFSEVFKEITKEGRRIDQRINDVLKEVSNLRGAFDQAQRRHYPND